MDYKILTNEEIGNVELGSISLAEPNVGDTMTNVDYATSDGSNLESKLVGGWEISQTKLAKGNRIILDAFNRAISIHSPTWGASGIQLQYNNGIPRCYFGDGANQYFKFDGTNISWKGTNTSLTTAGVFTASDAIISGSITATTGSIGGFTIDATTLTATNFTLDAGNQKLSLGTGNNIIIADAADTTYRLVVGHATYASAPFRVTKAGDVTATSITLSTNVVLSGLQAGSSVDGQYLAAASVASAAANLALRGWTQTSAFSSTSATKVSWGAGAFTASDGTSYAISAGNTGDMAARTYIYLDIAISTTAYQTTTTATTAIGNGKVLVATAINDTTSATFEVFGGVGGLFINGNVIAANSIVANQINVTNLSSIKADLGTITAGNITLDSSGYVRTTGATNYTTGTGIWFGYDVSDYKFRIGDPATDYLQWNGTYLDESLSATVELQMQKITMRGLSGMTNTVAGGSSITDTYSNSLLQTNSNLAAVKSTDDFIDATKNFAFGCIAKMTQGSSTSSSSCFCGIDYGGTGYFPANGVSLNPHAGIYVFGVWNGASYDFTGYLSTADGAAQTLTSFSGITFSNYNRYKIVKTASNVKLYVNGVLKATNSANLPNDTTSNMKFSAAESGGGFNTTLQVYANNIITQSLT
jgi:hypothetical protein